MLRIIVISLVVANLLLLGFQSSTPTVKPEARPAPAAVNKDSGIPTIHLFSEMIEDQGLLSGNRRCFTIGPFHSVADWDDVHVRLQKVATRISERQTEALVEKGYWVYMPPYPSLLEANKALLSLQALGLKDVAIIYDGEWKNSISLGYFMRQENAQRRKKALEDRGFNPKMRIQRQSEPRFWLDYEQEPGSGLVELDMQNRPNDFLQRPVPCPEAEFLEVDAVASRDASEIAPRSEVTGVGSNPVHDVEEGVDRPGTSEQDTQVPDQPEENKKQAAIEPGAGLEAGDTAQSPQVNNEGEAANVDVNAASQNVNEPENAPGGDGEIETDQVKATADDQIAETPTAGEAVKTAGDGVETVTTEVLDEATSSGDQATPVEGTGEAAAAEVETPPKQAVGTGPVDMLSNEPAPVETSAGEQDAGTPAGEASGNRTADGGQEPTDEGKGDTTTAPTGESGNPKAPEGTEKDSGN